MRKKRKISGRGVQAGGAGEAEGEGGGVGGGGGKCRRRGVHEKDEEWKKSRRMRSGWELQEEETEEEEK